MERSGGGGGGGREAGQISKQFTAEIPILLGLSKVRQSGLSQQQLGQSFHPGIGISERLEQGPAVTRPDKKMRASWS